MLNGASYKSNRYLTPNTAHNIQPNSSDAHSEHFQPYNDSDDKHAVFQYPKNECYEHCYKHTSSTGTTHHTKGSTERSRSTEQDDSLTSMEWLPEVSIPYMQQVQVRCKVSHEDIKKMPRKRNRNVTSGGGKACSTAAAYRKPDYSYAMLIYKAINDTVEKRMQLFQIYEWIENHFLYYKHTPGTHWKSSIRHNLSLHKIFVKEAPPPSLKSKGSFWALDRRMTEEDLLLSLQPKRPRLSRISGGESTCINRYAKGPYCPTLPHHNQYHQYGLHPHRQPLFQHVRNVSRSTHVQYRHAAPRTPGYHQQRREERHTEGYRSTSRPNILSKVVRKDSKDSPPGTSLMNLNQLFHTNNTENVTPGSNSYESGYSSLNDSSQCSPKARSFVCSTPVKNGVWSSPEFGFKSSPQISFPLSGDQEIPNLSHYMDSVADGQLSSCVKEGKAGSAGQFWSPTYGRHHVFYSPPRNNDSPQYEPEPQSTVSMLSQQVSNESQQVSMLSQQVSNESQQVSMLSQQVSNESPVPFPTTEPSIKEETEESPETNTSLQQPTEIKQEIKEAPVPPDHFPDPPSDEKRDDIADLITQFINEGEVCMLNGTFSTTPLRQYLTEDESSLSLDQLDSPKCSKKKTPIRRSLHEEMK